MTETRTIAIQGFMIDFFQIPNGRWVFSGSRNAAGYATAQDAAIEATAQIENRYTGRLNSRAVPNRVHNATWRDEIAPLTARGLR